EVLLRDPARTEHLDAHYEKLLGVLAASHRLQLLTTLKMLKLVSAYVRKKIFPPSVDGQTEAHTEELIKSYAADLRNTVFNKKGHPCTTIPLDYFIEKGIGVCRHHALTTAYLLDRLVRDKNA